MSKIITVFGATGNQGGSVVKYILEDPVLSKEFKIRGISRDVSKPAARALADQGIEMVAADMSSQEAAAPAVKGAHTVFFVTNFWELKSEEKEIAQGKAVADACKAAGVKHIIFSSLINVTEASNGRLPAVSHFDGKAKIEKYIRNSGVPATFVLPGFFMSNLFDMIRKNEDGSFSTHWPVSGEKAQVPLFNVADMGKWVNSAIKKFPSHTGKQIYTATDYYTPQRMVSEFSEVIGKPANFVQIPGDVFKSFLPEPIAQEMLENMLLLEGPGYYAGADLGESLGLLGQKPTSWKEFVGANKGKWLK